MKQNILKIYREEYLPQAGDRPIRYEKFLEYYSWDKMPMEEVLKIKKGMQGGDKRSHKGNSRIFRAFKEQGYRWGLSYFIRNKHYIYANSNDIKINLL